MQTFKRVTIIGPGLIGASLGLAIKEKGLAEEVIGAGRRESSLQTALDIGAIDRSTLDPAEGVEGADLVVLATGVATALKLGLAVMPHLKAGCLLIDVASAKTYLVDGLAPEVRDDVSYVSSHPMAGSEQKGAAAARVDLFDGAPCILTSTTATRAGDLDRVRELWESLGSRTCELDPKSHDLFLAEASHLPHIAASSLFNTIHTDSLEYSATGFKDTTRLASGDPEIWLEISICNRTALTSALRSYADELASFAEALESNDEQTILKKLTAAKEKRDGFYRDK